MHHWLMECIVGWVNGSKKVYTAEYIYPEQRIEISVRYEKVRYTVR